MDERTRTENQAMLDDQEDFTALSAKLISDLIDEEPDGSSLISMGSRVNLYTNFS